MSKVNSLIGKNLSSTKHASSHKNIESTLTAERFSIRGNKYLFLEITRLGNESGRSTNSEMVAAILEALSGNKLTNVLFLALKAYLGTEITSSTLETFKELDFKPWKVEAKFQIRIPPNVYAAAPQKIKDLLAETGQQKSMNTWIIESLVSWISIQHKLSALLIAAIETNNQT